MDKRILTAGEIDVLKTAAKNGVVNSAKFRNSVLRKLWEDGLIAIAPTMSDEDGLLTDYVITDYGVRILQATTDTAQPEALLPQTVDTVRYGTSEYEQLSREDCEREVERLQAELAAAKAENARLTERGSIIDWAIETAAVWNNFVSTTDQDAPVSEALALTLNVLCRKVEDYGRKQALAAGIGGGNGEASK